MYTQKTRNSKFLFLMLALVMAITSIVGYCFGGVSQTNVYATEEITASIAKRSGTTYYKGQQIEIDLGDGQTQSYTNVPDLEAWRINVSYGKKVVTIDAQKALVNGLTNTEGDQITIDDFNTNASFSGSKYHGEFTLTCRLSASTLEELGYSSTSAVSVSIPKISYTIYESQDTFNGAENVTKILNTVNNVLQNVLSPIIAVVLAVGMIFAIFLGAKLARADNAEQREEAKKRVIYTVIGIAIGVALIIVFNLFANYSIEWLGGDGNFFSL